MTPLIIARPEPGNGETAKAAQALGLDVVASPLFELQKTAWSAENSESYDAIFITSANALRAAGAELSAYLTLPLYAVGAASAAAARAAGFGTIVTGTADGAALAERAAADGRQRLLHLAGQPYKAIAHPRLTFDVRTSYAMAELPVSGELKEALRRPCVILAHSPRIAQRLAALVAERQHCHLIAISAQAAKAAGTGWASCQWPDQPDSDAMLHLAAPLCRSA